MNPHVEKIFASVTILLLCVGAFFATEYLLQSRLLPYSDDFSKAKVYWKEQVALLGPRAAYAAFQSYEMPPDGSSEHKLAHIMGESLYEVSGFRAITICDESHGYGCSHGFFLRAIAENGFDAIPELDHLCLQESDPVLATGCQHGMGHGLLETSGYNLSRALELCSGTAQIVPLLGCASGVYMEYFRPMGERPKAFDESEPYEPCASLPGDYQMTCYFHLGEWYWSILNGDQAKAKSLCSALSGDSRTHCFLGIGVAIPRSPLFAQQYIEKCESFLEHDALVCRAGLSWRFFTLPKFRSRTHELCVYFDIEKTRACEHLADFTEGRDPAFPKTPQ
jgi:hypothetical protein